LYLNLIPYKTSNYLQEKEKLQRNVSGVISICCNCSTEDDYDISAQPQDDPAAMLTLLQFGK
jgi:hypothetical protein